MSQARHESICILHMIWKTIYEKVWNHRIRQWKPGTFNCSPGKPETWNHEVAAFLLDDWFFSPVLLVWTASIQFTILSASKSRCLMVEWYHSYMFVRGKSMVNHPSPSPVNWNLAGDLGIPHDFRTSHYSTPVILTGKHTIQSPAKFQQVTIAELLSDRTRANDADGVWRIVAPRSLDRGVMGWSSLVFKTHHD